MRGAFFLLVTAGLVLVAPSCATGDDATSSESAATGDGDGGAADAAGCAKCPGDQVCSAGACVPPNTDADGDGVLVTRDCDDRDPNVRPGAPEICNGKDDNCDGKIDEGFDEDGDGYFQCSVAGKKPDCDDKDAKVNPAMPEVCNNKDDNCDGITDEGFDKDGDGYYACARGTTPVDCDDGDAKIKPGGTEICNGKDDDCNGKTDELPAFLDSDNATTSGRASLYTPVSSRWVLVGDAALGPSVSGLNGWVRLNSDTPSVRGALWFNAPYLFDSFDMTSTIWIQNKADGADGMAFAWIAGNDVTQAGGVAGGYGVLGLTSGGYAVAIDTYLNADTDIAVPFLVLAEVKTRQRIGTAALPNIRDGANHTLRVKLDGGKVSVWVDGTSYMNDLAIPGYVPFTGHWGFGGATGGLSEVHWVSGIKMKFPNGQGCVVP